MAESGPVNEQPSIVHNERRPDLPLRRSTWTHQNSKSQKMQSAWLKVIWEFCSGGSPLLDLTFWHLQPSLNTDGRHNGACTTPCNVRLPASEAYCSSFQHLLIIPPCRIIICALVKLKHQQHQSNCHFSAVLFPHHLFPSKQTQPCHGSDGVSRRPCTRQQIIVLSEQHHEPTICLSSCRLSSPREAQINTRLDILMRFAREKRGLEGNTSPCM